MVTTRTRSPLVRFLQRVWRSPRSVFRLLTLPWWTAAALLNPSVGREYGISRRTKLGLLRKMWRNSQQPGSASTFFEHVFIVTRLLTLPRQLEGSVAEFGCYKGFSTASLSAACALTGRRLVVFDSFEGLPPTQDIVHNFETGISVPYAGGQYKGALEEVKANVERFGEVRVCEFVKGYFEDTLPLRSAAEKFVLIFEDADLTQSVRSVLTGTWKKLQPGCTFFCHEARDREVVNIFFDQQWWKATIGEAAPGFIGSGAGIVTGPDLNSCCLGFTVRPRPGSNPV
jgi:O-methyltransferase